MCISAVISETRVQAEENVCCGQDVMGDLGLLDVELAEHFVSGPETSAKRRKTGSVEVPNVGDGFGGVGAQPGEAQPHVRGIKRKDDARGRSSKREQSARKERKSERRVGGFAEVHRKVEAQRFGFMDSSFDRKRSKEEKCKAG